MHRLAAGSVVLLREDRRRREQSECQRRDDNFQFGSTFHMSLPDMAAWLACASNVAIERSLDIRLDVHLSIRSIRSAAMGAAANPWSVRRVRKERFAR